MRFSDMDFNKYLLFRIIEQRKSVNHTTFMDTVMPTGFQHPLERRNDWNAQISVRPKSRAQFQFIKRAMKENELLRGFSDAQQNKMIECMFPLEFRAGSYLHFEGNDDCMKLYLLVEGYLENGRMNRKNTWNSQLVVPGKIIGEVNILSCCKWEVSVFAKSDVKVLCLDGKIFKAAMKTLAMRIRSDHVRLLKNVDKLKFLPEFYLLRLADCLEEKIYLKGNYIFKECDTDRNLYIIKNGLVKVTKTQMLASQEFHEVYVTCLESGNCFGEEVLHQKVTRTSNVIAETENVSVLVLDILEVHSLLGSINDLPPIYQKIDPIEDKYFNEDDDRYMSIGKITPEDVNKINKISLGNLQAGRIIAQGCNSYVRIVKIPGIEHRSFGLNTISKSHIIKSDALKHALAAKDVMMIMKSSFIGRLYRTFQNELNLYFLMDCYLGGNVEVLLRLGPFDEAKARFCASNLIEALEYLHSRGIAHRDLKPHNLALDHRGYVKLLNFHCAKHFQPGAKAYTFCGTKSYCAPEIILHKGYDSSVDFWSLGIVIYQFLTQTTPFYSGGFRLSFYEKILAGMDEVEFHKGIPKPAEMLIRSLCKSKPTERIGQLKNGIDDIRMHPWFHGFDWHGLKSHHLPSPFIVVLDCPFDTRNYNFNPEIMIDEHEERKIIASSPIIWDGLF